MNISDALKFKGMWDKFTRNHPKFPAFIKAIRKKGIHENTIIEVKITEPDGEVIETNIKVTAGDMELFSSLSKFQQ